MTGLRHFVDLWAIEAADLRAILDDARQRKAARAGWPKGRLDADAPGRDRTLAMIFQKNSTRTRFSFHAAMRQIGGASIIASGPRSVFDTVEPYLKAIAPSVTYAGAGKEARLVKLAHNLLVGMITESLAEVTTLAEKGGVSPSAFLDFIDGSVLGSTFIGYKGQAIRTHDYEPTFTTELLRKDFDLGLGAARSLEVPMPVAATTYQAIQTAIGHGYGKSDFATLYEVAARAAALQTETDRSWTK